LRTILLQRYGLVPEGTDMAKIKKVGHVVLGVRDTKRSISFYTEILKHE